MKRVNMILAIFLISLLLIPDTKAQQIQRDRPLQVTTVTPGSPFSQNWSVAYEGPYYEYANDIVEFMDSSGLNLYAIASYSTSYSTDSTLTVSVFNHYGRQMWSKKYIFGSDLTGNSQPVVDVQPVKIAAVPDGLIVVGSYKYLNGRALMLKVSKVDGHVIFARDIRSIPCMSEPSACDIRVVDAVVNSDGVVTLLGYFRYSGSVVGSIELLYVVPSDGHIIFEERLEEGSGAITIPRNIARIADYKYVITGYSGAISSEVAARVGPSGLIWQKAINVNAKFKDLYVRGNEAVILGDVDIILWDRDIAIISLNAENGSFNGARQVGGSAIDEGKSIFIDEDGSYVILASTSSYGQGLSDAWFLRVESLAAGNGPVIQSVAMGGRYDDEMISMIKSSVGDGIMVAGTTLLPTTVIKPGNIWLMRTNGLFEMDFISASGAWRSLTAHPSARIYGGTSNSSLSMSLITPPSLSAVNINVRTQTIDFTEVRLAP